MIPHSLLSFVLCLLTVSSILATPILSGQTEGLAARGVYGRDVLVIQDAVAQFTANLSTIRTNLDTIGSANVSKIDVAKKATDDLKISYDNFHANLEALKAAKKSQVKERGFPFSSCGVIKDVGGLIKDVMIVVNVIKSAIEGEPVDANEIIAVVFATLSIIAQGVPSLLALALSICSPF